MAHVLLVDVPRPIDEVFDFLADLRHAPEWNEPSLRVQQIGSTPIAMGSRFREKHAKLGELTTELVRYDRPHRFSFRTTDGDTTIDGEVNLTAVSGGTQPRRDGAAWTRARSWLGGRPRLGNISWPRAGNRQVPMTHVAWIDLRQLAERAPGTPLPNDGALAFFLGALEHGYACVVIHVPQIGSADTDPPKDSPPAYLPYGEVFPLDASVGSRTFPRWPVELTQLVPESPAEEDDLRAVVSRYATLPQYAFAASTARQALGHAPLPTYWQTARQLAERLNAAVSRLDALRALKAKHSASGDAFNAFDAGRQTFIEFTEEVDRWSTGRLTWEAMTPDEIQVLTAMHARARQEFGTYARAYTPNAAKDLETEALRVLARADDPAAWTALPAPVRELLDQDHQLPVSGWHQMFGRGVDIQGAVEEHRDDYLLLQLVYDDLMEWLFGDVGAFQFWISADALGRREWSRATVTFESH